MNDNDSEKFVRDFLFGPSEIRQERENIRSEMFMDQRIEGWIGIPHGGIGMGAILELFLALDSRRADGSSLYPIHVDFNMGGARPRIGDKAAVEVSSRDGGAEGSILLDEQPLPYITADISFPSDDPDRRILVASYMPPAFPEIENKLIQLPYYKNCFVCGAERRHPGLNRKFFFLSGTEAGKIVVSPAGFNEEDARTFCRFRKGNFIHPMAFLALLDETMGWASIMLTGSGAVSVRIDFTFYRDVAVSEKIMAFGRGERVRGKAGSRLLSWASGGIAVVKEDGNLEVVMTASGQWMGIPALTEQLKTELIPKEWVHRIFEPAAAP
jgi:hypothetical protein